MVEPILDQWQAQTLAVSLQKARIGVHAQMETAAIEQCKLEAVENLDNVLQKHIKALGECPRVAPCCPMDR